MAAIFAFKCLSCAEIHEGAPSFAFRAPAPFLEQAKEVQEAGMIGSDLCWYEDEDGHNFFVRVCLEVPIIGVSEPFTWGVWASLSEVSFNPYRETYDSPDPSASYFGWLSNYLPYYENTYALKTQVRPRADGIRPFLELEKTRHPLSIDFYEGISVERAQEIAEALLHR
ncbi:MAG TPA: DUF2199 domain-containing protein [Noviherbaspirillum sp.]|jgi:hypothetical protein|uniref:DUF2199 domain-containing protein n=1 Tax=Noviherbaspirillum sp. TaxID=1926288 RepID=UPI002DDDAE54|nr:DUF2199 domain-containing protein [Noviherbaspirillum sp.]HEV2611984.1 DUF2199 domain-containing protein [Noviherbaspirillum sp.]